MPPVLFDLCFMAAVAVAAYAVITRPAFLPPVRPAAAWGQRRDRLRSVPGRLIDAPAPSSLGLLTAAGAVLAIAGLALGLLLDIPQLGVLLAVIAFVAPGWLRRRRQTAWRRELLLELGDAVEYLELHFAAGATVPDAIAGTAAFLVGPLAGELRGVLARAALLQDGSRALDELAQRLADPDLTAVARRLSAAWRLRAPGPDTFAGFGDTLRHIRETHIAARTKTLPVAYVAIAGWMIFALVAIVAVPAGTAFLHSLSSF